MRLEAFFDQLHARARAIWWLHPFTVATRALLVLGFVPPGLKKLVGHRFTQLPLSDPVGFFFEAFYRTGIWYRFVGASQIVAAVLLVFPRTAALGAVIYLVLAVNVFLITVGVGFTGTPLITGAMLLAALYLVCWDYPRWKGLLFAPAPDRYTLTAAQRRRVAHLSAIACSAALAIYGAGRTAFAISRHRAVPASALAMLVVAIVTTIAALLDWRRATSAAATG